MNEDINRYIEECIRRNGGELPTMDVLNRYLQEYMEKQNNRSMLNFEGYSSQDMFVIIHNLWSDGSPVKLKTLNEEDLESIPLLRQIKQLISIIQREGKIKLTNTGNLPVKFVKEIHPLGYVAKYDKELAKISKETDSFGVHFTHLMAKVMKVVKVQKSVMTLTKSGEKLSKQPQQLFEELMFSMCGRYNFGYFDRYNHPHIGSMASGFSIILMAKYGSKKRIDRFYSDKYFEAFPKLLDEVVSKFDTIENEAARCYSFRTFDIFMRHLGLIELEQEKILSDIYVTKTVLFDKIFKIETVK